MIVKRDLTKPRIQIDVKCKEENQDVDGYQEQEKDILISLNIDEIENIFTIEEEKYFENSLAVFNENWRAIPFGEEIMSHYMKFCDTRHTLSPKFFLLINSQLR